MITPPWDRSRLETLKIIARASGTLAVVGLLTGQVVDDLTGIAPDTHTFDPA